MNIIFYRFGLVFFILITFFVKNINSKDMMFIPNGTYVPLFKGLENDAIRVVDEFFCDKYPVSNLEFFLFVLNNPSWDINNIRDVFSDHGYLAHWVSINDFNSLVNVPVVNISWFASNSFCNYFSCSLPTVDEWEYMAGFNELETDKSTYFDKVLNWYIGSHALEYINIFNMPCNSLSICGMNGFIWEWVKDFNSVILLNTDAEGGGLEEVLYCGATAANAIDPADYISFMRFAFRNTLEANYTMNKLGFRCVKYVF